MSAPLPPATRTFVGSGTYALRYACPVMVIGCVVFVPLGDAPVGAIALALLMIFSTFCGWRSRVNVYPDRVRVVYPFVELTVARVDIVSVDPRVGLHSGAFRGPSMFLRDGKRMSLTPLNTFSYAFKPRSRAATELARELGLPET
jgi:hypothetical protein